MLKSLQTIQPTKNRFMKTILTFSFCLLAAANLMAQGRVNFSNTSGTAIRITSTWYGYNGVDWPPGWHYGVTNILGTASTATFGIGPASARIQLYAGLSSTSLSPVLIGTSANLSAVTNTASTVAVAQGTFNGGSSLPLHGYDGSAPVYLQARVLSINGSYYGETPIQLVSLATGVAPATPLFGTGPGQWDGILIGYPELYPAPEPSSMSLVLLGSLAIFRRRFLGLR
jgi:hypothetical protein